MCERLFFNRMARCVVAAVMLMTSGPAAAQWWPGGAGSVPDPNGYDSNHPIKDTFSRTGVVGGVQDPGYVKAWLSPGDDIQAAINNGGPGIVHLSGGTYNLNSPLYMQDGVVLRGADRDGTVLSISMTSTWKQFAIQFGTDTSYAGLENLSISYDAHWQGPVDRWGVQNGGLYYDAFENNPNGRNDLYVGSVGIWGSNNWLDSVNIRKSGTDPILVQGNHNTVRNSYIDQAYNKGGGGHGYVDIRGDNNLFAGNTVRRVRHLAIQQGAQYNVVLDNWIEGDVNFHNGDAGQNLIERNTIYRPSWHLWRPLGTGGAEYGHQPPGGYNVIFNNEVWDYAEGWSQTPNTSTTYTFWNYGNPSATGWHYPNWGTYYNTKAIPEPWSAGDIGSGGAGSFISESGGTWNLQATGADVWNNADDFYYVWQRLHGDGEMVVRVVSQENTDPWAKAGIMVRESLDVGSKHAQVSITPENGAVFQYRQWTGSSSDGTGLGDTQVGSTLLKMRRVANTLTGYIWQDDQWVVVGTTDLSMWEEAHIGFFASSHDTWDFADVSFDQVDVLALLTPNKLQYDVGEDIEVRFGTGTGHQLDWVGIYAEGDTPGVDPSLAWYYVNNSQSASWWLARGTIIFEDGAGLEDGDYYLGFFAQDGYAELSERVYFQVGHVPEPSSLVAIGLAGILVWRRRRS